MRVHPILFWALAAVTMLWCGMASVGSSVSEFYHPMSVLGDRLHSVRAASISIPILVSITMLVLWVWRRRLSRRIYLLGMVPLVVAAALPILPRIDSGYEQSFWLGEQRHSIPWGYGPFNGHAQPGGTHFLVRVRGPDLRPFYRSEGDWFTIGKALDFRHERVGIPQGNVCDSDWHVRCEWKSGDYVYSLSVAAASSPVDPQTLFRPIEDLLGSFETDTP